MERKWLSYPLRPLPTYEIGSYNFFPFFFEQFDTNLLLLLLHVRLRSLSALCFGCLMLGSNATPSLYCLN
jgi:hypothetical protein